MHLSFNPTFQNLCNDFLDTTPKALSQNEESIGQTSRFALLKTPSFASGKMFVKDAFDKKLPTIYKKQLNRKKTN